MKRKNILLIVFMLTLFFFQQVQAGGSMPSPRKSEIKASLSGGWDDVVFIRIYPLNMNDGTIHDFTPCTWATNNEPGCGPSAPLFTGTVYQDSTVDCNDKPQNPYPRKSDPNDPYGYYYLCIEGDYLPDVLPTEMNLGQIRPPEVEALKALAVAARTFVKYKAPNGEVINNSSTSYQVYVPWSNTLSYGGVSYQNEIVSAINSTSWQYLSYNGNVIDAEYSSEIFNETSPGGQDYLITVQEPISSSICSTQGSIGNSWGISQRGAIRWAKGSTCPDGTGETWPINETSPIKWNYQQILVHYYTGVNIVGATTPDDRWNLLNYDVPNGTTVTIGTPFDISLMVQNTSVFDWNGDGIEIGYHWGDQVWHVARTLPSGFYP
ncbi:MAG: SpoIID/LytB domain-containing protein, partial [Chloroflexota bacterium]